MNINKSDGWVKISRKLQDSWLSEDHTALVVFVSLLVMAHHEDNMGSIRFNGKQKYLKRGQLAGSTRELARKIYMPLSTFNGALTRLKADQIIDQLTDHSKTIITICNYSKYQDKPDQSTDRSPITDRSLTDHFNLSPKNKEIKNKEILTNVSTAKTDVVKVEYGDSRINEMVKIFEDAIEMPLPRKQKQRHAAKRLLTKYGDKAIDGCRFAVSIMGKPYAPSIGDILSLEDNWTKLVMYGKRTSNKQERITVI